MKTCCFCKERPARTGQRDCKECHAAKNREYRKAHRRRVAMLEKRFGDSFRRSKA